MPANTRPTARSELKKTVAKGARVRQPEIWAVRGEKLDDPCVVGQDVNRPRLDLAAHALVEVIDLERHASMLANSLTPGKRTTKLPPN